MCLSHLILNSVWELPQVQDVNSGEDCCLSCLPVLCLVHSSRCQSLSTQRGGWRRRVCANRERWRAEPEKREREPMLARWTKGNVNNEGGQRPQGVQTSQRDVAPLSSCPAFYIQPKTEFSLVITVCTHTDWQPHIYTHTGTHTHTLYPHIWCIHIHL